MRTRMRLEGHGQSGLKIIGDEEDSEVDILWDWMRCGVDGTLLEAPVRAHSLQS